MPTKIEWKCFFKDRRLDPVIVDDETFDKFQPFINGKTSFPVRLDNIAFDAMDVKYAQKITYHVQAPQPDFTLDENTRIRNLFKVNQMKIQFAARTGKGLNKLSPDDQQMAKNYGIVPLPKKKFPDTDFRSQISDDDWKKFKTEFWDLWLYVDNDENPNTLQQVLKKWYRTKDLHTYNRYECLEPNTLYDDALETFGTGVS